MRHRSYMKELCQQVDILYMYSMLSYYSYMAFFALYITSKLGQESGSDCSSLKSGYISDPGFNLDNYMIQI